MEHVNKLIIRAKKAALRKGRRFLSGIVFRNDSMWLAQGSLWAGKRGEVWGITTRHDTMEAAIDALNSLAEEYPNTVEDAVILIDNITE